MKYYQRLGIYKASNLTFNPNTFEGYSYAWYLITARIKGELVLNTYNYSPTTRKHVYKLRALLNELELPYIEIESPGGLQKLESAMYHHMKSLARKQLANEYARNKNDQIGHYDNRCLMWLKSWGVKANYTQKIARFEAKVERENRLASQKQKRVSKAEAIAREAPKPIYPPLRLVSA